MIGRTFVKWITTAILLGCSMCVVYPKDTTSAKMLYSVNLSFYKSVLEDTSRRDQNLIPFYDSIINYAYLTEDTLLALEYQESKILTLMEYGNTYQAYVEGMMLFYDIVIEKKWKNYPEVEEIKKRIQINLITLSISNGSYKDGVNMAFDYLQDYKDISNQEKISIYRSLTGLFIAMEMIDKVEEYAKKSMDLMNSMEEVAQKDKVSVYNNYAGFFIMSRDFDSALHYLEIAKQSANGDKKMLTPIYSNLALVATILGQQDLSLDYLSLALQTITYKEQSYVKGRIWCNIASVYATKKAYDTAVEIYNRVIEYAQEIKYLKLQYRALNELSDLYVEMGKIDMAERKRLMAYKLQDSVDKIEDRDRMSIIEKEYELSEILRENDRIKEELMLLKIRNERKYLISGWLVLVFFVFFFIFFYKMREERRKNKEIEKKFDEYVSYTESALNMKSQSLSDNIIRSIHYTEVLKKVKNQIGKLLSAKNSEEKDEIAMEIKKYIMQIDFSDNTMDEVLLHFGEHHPDFSSRLLQICPDLTKKDLLLATFIVSEMSAKDIAKVWDNSVRSVETSIYRFRKKLGIEKKVVTLDFLKKFL